MLVPGGQYQYVTMQNAASATGNGTAIETGGDTDGAYTILDMHVEGISGDTITFEATIDGTNWIAIKCENLNDDVRATTATADGLYRFVVGGVIQVRARISTYSAGTITVTGSAAA